MNSFSNEKVELTNCQFRRDQVSKNAISARIRKLSLILLSIQLMPPLTEFDFLKGIKDLPTMQTEGGCVPDSRPRGLSDYPWDKQKMVENNAFF